MVKNSTKASRRLLSKNRTRQPPCKLHGCSKLARSGSDGLCYKHFIASVSIVAAVACLVCHCAAQIALSRSIYPSVFICLQPDTSHILHATSYILQEIAAFIALPSTCCNNLCAILYNCNACYLPRTVAYHVLSATILPHTICKHFVQSASISYILQFGA
jgi:hypothetical protein